MQNIYYLTDMMIWRRPGIAVFYIGCFWCVAEALQLQLPAETL